MADVEYGYRDDGHVDEAVPSASLINVLGALLSFGLVIGLAIWGFKLTARDAGAVPVIAALEGPMRVQPEDPGGEQAAHQGLAVNAIQADGAAPAPAERIVLAPKPVDLFAKKPMVTDAETMSARNVPATAPVIEERVLTRPTTAPAARQLISAKPTEEVSQDPVAAALALAEKLVAGAQKFEAEQAAATSLAVTEQAENGLAEIKVIDASIPGVKKSPRPMSRPGGDLRLATSAIQAEAAADTSVDLDPSKVVAGMRLVQLGAFGSPEIARAEWDRRVADFGEYIGDKKRVIQRTETGGRVFYRLRVAGFEGLSDARRFCTVLLAENAACIPVVAR